MVCAIIHGTGVISTRLQEHMNAFSVPAQPHVGYQRHGRMPEHVLHCSSCVKSNAQVAPTPVDVIHHVLDWESHGERSRGPC